VKKIFLIVLILPVLIFGGLKGALWYFTKTAMEDVARKASAFVDLRYEGIETSLQGSVTVHEISLYSALVDDTVRIDSLKLQTNDIFSLLSLHFQLKKNEIPESMLVHVQGVTLDLDGNLMKTFTNPDVPVTIGDTLNTLACGNTSRFDTEAMKGMGYQSLLADFIFQYRFDEGLNKLHLTFIENLDRLFSLTLNASITNIKPKQNIARMASGAKPGQVSISYDDDSFASRKIKFCATQNKSSEAEYINKHVMLFDEYLRQMGIDLGSDLLGAYKETYLKPGDIELSADFRGIDNILELTEIPIPDIIHNISAQLTVNGKKISSQRLSINKDLFMQAALGKTKKTIQVEDPNVIPKAPPKEFHKVAKSKLDQYKHHQVKIKTRNGKTYQGKLNITKSHRFKYEISNRTRGGTMSSVIAEEDIISVEVYY